MPKSPLAALVASLVALSGACSDEAPRRPSVLEDGPPSPPRSAGGTPATSDGGTGDAAVAASCTELPEAAPLIDQVAFGEALPPASGGEIVDGLYDLTEARLYRGLGGAPGLTGARYEGALATKGARFERVFGRTTQGSAATVARSSGTLTASGTSLTLSVTCPTASLESLAYSATATLLTLSNLATGELFVFARRP